MVLAGVAASVAAGDTSTPVVVAALVAAPLLGLLLTDDARARLLDARGAGDVAILVGLTLLLAANVAVLGDLARELGLARAHGVAAAAAVALLVVGWQAGEAWWRLATPLGAAVVILPVALVVAGAGAPWTTWAALASRPALTFDAASAWVTGGRAIGERTTLTFGEPHRMIAAAPATWRVTERDAARISVREWRLGTGDALTLRPGDQLALERGARVRFEAGRRVPTAAPSGVAWADGRGRSTVERLAAALGILVAVVGGGVALAPALAAPALAAVVVPLVLLTFVTGAALWGLYGMALAPALSLTPRALAPVFEALSEATRGGWRPALTGVVATGLLVLLAGTVLAWRGRLAALVDGGAAALGRPGPSRAVRSLLLGGVVLTSAALALRGDDPWRLFTGGLAVIAALAIVPRLATPAPRAQLAGALAGAVAFALAALHALPWLTASFAAHPVLLAAPTAFLIARLARRAAR
ncbi:MAG: hypothetical protein FJ027_14390 [Candidatus Rokubacteria bacterium]|nr:hypothetical protein [Candidatus Rokubacteria bacterium]